MKRAAVLLALLVLAGGAFLFCYPRLSAPHVQSPFEAAALLEQDAQAGGDGVTFRTEEINLDAVYRALEARYPYAFALHATERPDRTTGLEVQTPRAARPPASLTPPPAAAAAFPRRIWEAADPPDRTAPW